MIDLKNIRQIYFVGIGGIGMSAIAKYFIDSGCRVAGYDRTKNAVTDSLSASGCNISFVDDISTVPQQFIRNSDNTVIVYTPAIPEENNIITFFREKGFPIYKRSEILGELSKHTDTIAVAGTHGKSTVSAMTTHILKCSGIDCSAFLGGISKNYGSNFIRGHSRFTVMEADEFDRSFHKLSPLHAIITATDADHLDIYKTLENMREGYSIFCEKIRREGTLILNDKVKEKVRIPSYIKHYTYGNNDNADYSYSNVKLDKGRYFFSLKTPEKTFENIEFDFPGITNVENLTAAAALALQCGATGEGIRKAALSFAGVKRRFDIRVNRPGLTYIDDYAHHPEEIKACINSITGYFGKRKITGIFQPHLYSRTRDNYLEFAQVLDRLDEVILLPIYPAREKPIEGVSSEMILKEMKLKNKKILNKSDLPDALDTANLDVLVTIGAGDIDTIVTPIEEKLLKENRH